jgi:hypothetical protein
MTLHVLSSPRDELRDETRDHVASERRPVKDDPVAK